MLVIGDVHGKINQYKAIVDNCDRSICVGDFGFKKEHDWHLKNVDSQFHKINFGNHDDYAYLECQHSTHNWSMSTKGYMTVRGADSIDKHFRKEGISWWPNEELSYSEMGEAIDDYIKWKPKIMIT